MTFFVETNILNIHLFTILNLTVCFVNMNWSHRKWHNSVIMSPSDLRQVSKFSLVRYLKLFLWHPKDLFSRKILLRKPKYFLKWQVFLFTHLKSVVGIKVCPAKNSLSHDIAGHSYSGYSKTNIHLWGFPILQMSSVFF